MTISAKRRFPRKDDFREKQFLMNKNKNKNKKKKKNIGCGLFFVGLTPAPNFFPRLDRQFI
jgi:hypothetical protein